jgi:predicted PurR-regulated permease PerM
MGFIAILIPIFALSIPIIAIIAGTYAKTHKGDPQLIDRIKHLEDKIKLLDTSVQNLQSDVLKIEDNNKFLNKLLEDKSDK